MVIPSLCNYKPHIHRHTHTDSSCSVPYEKWLLQTHGMQHSPYHKFFLIVKYLNFPPLQSGRYGTDNLPQKSALLESISHTLRSSYLPHSPVLLNHASLSSQSGVSLTPEVKYHWQQKCRDMYCCTTEGCHHAAGYEDSQPHFVVRNTLTLEVPLVAQHL